MFPATAASPPTATQRVARLSSAAPLRPRDECQESPEFRSILYWLHKPPILRTIITKTVLRIISSPQKSVVRYRSRQFAVERGFETGIGIVRIANAAISSGIQLGRSYVPIHLQGEFGCVRIRVDRATGQGIAICSPLVVGSK